MIAIVDYGMGNLRSVAQALRHVAPDADVRIAGTATAIDAAERVVLPGQGAMPDCMRHLREAGLEAAVRRAAASRPLLAVCIGEQMLFEHTEEGDCDGLGLFAGQVVRFRDADMQRADGSRRKVPHMGWNRVRQLGSHPLWEGVPDEAHFYFVHSFHVEPAERAIAAGESRYGRIFTCAVARDNIFATQFHPEKSAADGLTMYANFVRWQP